MNNQKILLSASVVFSISSLILFIIGNVYLNWNIKIIDWLNLLLMLTLINLIYQIKKIHLN